MKKDIGMIKLKMHFYHEEKREYRQLKKEIETYLYETNDKKDGEIHRKLVKIQKNLNKMKMNVEYVNNMMDIEELVVDVDKMLIEGDENKTHFIPIESNKEDNDVEMYISSETD